MRGKVNGRFAPNRDAEPEEDDSSRWLGTYGDAITLLMAFFVMLYAMSETDAQKFEAFVSGLQGPFGNTAVTQSMLPSGNGIVGPAVPTQVFPNATREIAPEVELVERADPAGAAGEDEGRGEPGEDGEVRLTGVQEDQLRRVEEALERAFADVGFEGVADYRLEARGLVVSIASDNVLFDTGSTTIREDGRDIVDTLADVLVGYPNDVIVEGHTDDVPLARAGYSNWNLSTDRAVAVVNLLIEDHDLDPVRLGAAGFADQRPRAPNDTAANRALNRRVDVLVVAQGVTDG